MPAGMTATPPCCSARPATCPNTASSAARCSSSSSPPRKAGVAPRPCWQTACSTAFRWMPSTACTTCPARRSASSCTRSARSWPPATAGRVTFRGTGGHGGATPHLSTDVLVLQAQFITGAANHRQPQRRPPSTPRSSASARSPAARPDALNVMPAKVVLGGTARSYTPAVRDTMERRMRELATGLAASFGCTAEVEYDRVRHRPGEPCGANRHRRGRRHRRWSAPPRWTATAPPVTGGEDFASMLQAKPGAFVFLGQGAGGATSEGAPHARPTISTTTPSPTAPVSGSAW